MKCDECRKLIGGGAATPAALAHRDGCAECRRVLADLDAEIELLRSVEPPEVPVGLAARTIVRCAGEGPRWWRAWRPAATLALVAAGLLLGIAIGQNLDGPGCGLRERMAAAGLPVEEVR